MHNAYRHRSEDGKDELMSGFLPLSQYLEEYERLSGLPVDRKRLQYYRVLVSYMSVVTCGATGYRFALGGKTHQDIVVACPRRAPRSPIRRWRRTSWRRLEQI